VKKGNAELVGKLNEGIAAIKADGSYNTIFKKYFGTEPAAAAAPAKAASK
jgi:polar amino acid transport system substrate-binding protein